MTFSATISSSRTTSSRALFFLLPAVLLATRSADAATFSVTPDGGANGSPYDLTAAMGLAGPGDTVSLGDGVYDRAIVTVTDGKQGSPIVVEGSRNAVIQGDHSSRSVLVTHSWITLQGFTVEGKVGSENEMEAYINKCIYVEGTGSNLDGFVMEDLHVQNCGGECVRLKNSVVNAQIINNVIQDCGVHDYVFNRGEKNGEGVYIGTSSKLWENGPDPCNDNLVSGNTIMTNANECVDIKEGATGNIIEDNICSDQLDEKSGCFDSRGDGNIFRYNTATNCKGVGIRFGGWDADGHQYGQDNSAYGNDITNAAVGVLKLERMPQNAICGNTCEDGTCIVAGADASFGDVEKSWNQACDGVPPADTTSDGGSDEPDTDGSTSDEDSPSSSHTPSPGSSDTSSGTRKSSTDEDEGDDDNNDEEREDGGGENGDDSTNTYAFPASNEEDGGDDSEKKSPSPSPEQEAPPSSSHEDDSKDEDSDDSDDSEDNDDSSSSDDNKERSNIINTNNRRRVLLRGGRFVGASGRS